VRRVALAGLLAATLPSALPAQVEAFAYRPDRVPVGRVFHYLKSNRDGTHPGLIALYVAAQDRIEAFKYDSGGSQATLVVGFLDWEAMTVRRLEAYGVRRGEPDQPRAWLDSDWKAGGVRVFYAPDSLVRIARWPWHSYDFDFASLNLVLPHLRQPEGRLEFGRADIVRVGDGAEFRDLGALALEYEGRETRQGVAVRRYRLDGPGIENTTGLIWAAVEQGHIVEFELPIPDEPGYTDGRLRLLRVETLTPEGWHAWRRRMVD
jgi:hypothetical protein